MERITFKYTGTGDFEDSKDQHDIYFTIEDKDERGLRDYEVCEKFFDFMRAIGFSERNILNYFKE